MSNIYAFALGAMVAYTPSLIFLAYALCRPATLTESALS
jgi:hypothetical protein